MGIVILIIKLRTLISEIYFWNKTLNVSDISVLILLASCQQTCMTYTVAVRTAKNS